MITRSLSRKITALGAGIAFCAFTGCTQLSGKKYHVSTLGDISAVEPVVIIGGGLGGMTAGVYLSMAGYSPLILAGNQPGGLITQSTSVRNWPGELDIIGTDLANKVHAQVLANGGRIEAEEVTAINLKSWPYELTAQKIGDPASARTIKFLSCVIAMGTTPNYLQVPGEQVYWGRGVTNCATCDGELYRTRSGQTPKTVIVVGGGDAAVTEASYLAPMVGKVIMLVRADKMRARDKRKDIVTAMPNVEVRYKHQIKEVAGDRSGLREVVIADGSTGSTYRQAVDGLFLAIGSTPNSAILRGQLTMDKQGYVELTQDQATSVPGVFAVGDIADPRRYKQAVTAAGDGCKAALQSIRFLEEAGYMLRGCGCSAGGKPNAAANTPKPKEEPTALLAAAAKPAATPAAFHEPELPKLTALQSEQEFRDILTQTHRPICVDFYASWCGPCKAMLPVFDKLSQEFGDRVVMIKVNVDTFSALADQYNVRGIPCFIFMSKGENHQEVTRVVGMTTRDTLAQNIKKIL